MEGQLTIQEKAAENAFSLQAPDFDRLYGNDTIIQYKRERVRSHIEAYLPANARILELNAGTGEDALYFANKGHKVHATDISGGMLKILSDKVKLYKLDELITNEQCSFNNLRYLQNKGPYDLLYSNFAGLNCTDRLEEVLASFHSLVKPGGLVTLVILPRFCLWETLLLFRGKFRTAFRRFAGKKGAKAKINGNQFRCWYYNPAFVRKHLRTEFDVASIEGLCTLVPPSYLENFTEKHPSLYRFLLQKEKKWKSGWPWRSIGDYYIITLRKKKASPHT